MYFSINRFIVRKQAISSQSKTSIIIQSSYNSHIHKIDLRKEVDSRLSSLTYDTLYN